MTTDGPNLARAGPTLAATALLLLTALAAAQPATAQMQMDRMNHGGGGLDSGNLTRGMIWVHQFDSEGEFYYHCHPHPFMTGQIVISSTDQSALEGAVDVQIQGYAFHPAKLVIKPGTIVRWTNLDNDTHTVTQEVESADGLWGIPWWQVGVLVGAVVLAVPLFFLKAKKRNKGSGGL